MPWVPLPKIAFAIATHPFFPVAPADLPLELGDELYIIEEGGQDWSWYRGYLVAPPSLLAGLSSVKGQTLEARVFSGVFPRNCVEIREFLGQGDGEASQTQAGSPHAHATATFDRAQKHGLSHAALAENTQTAAENGHQLVHAYGNGNGVKEKRSTSSGTGRFRPPAPVPMLKNGDETPTSSTEPLVDEIASCLREWHSTTLLLSRDYTTLSKLTDMINVLDTSRRQLLHGVLTSMEARDLRLKTVWELAECNKMLRSEVVVRDPERRGRLLTGSDNPIDISKQQATMSILDGPPASAPDNVNLHHILVEVKDFVASDTTEERTLVANISMKRGPEPLVPLTESFSMSLPSRDGLQNTLSTGNLRTLFPDLTSMDAGLSPGSDVSLYLVVKVISTVEISRSVPTEPRPATARDAPVAGGEFGHAASSVGSKSARRSQLATAKFISPTADKSQRNPAPQKTHGCCCAATERLLLR
jgi:dedicator of cytokinesis protein 3